MHGRPEKDRYPSTPEPPENSPKDSENAPGVALRGSKPAQEQAEIVAIGLAHPGRRVIGGNHGFFNDACEQIEAGGCGAWSITFMGGLLCLQRTLLLREGVARQFVEADRDRLPRFIEGWRASVGISTSRLQ